MTASVKSAPGQLDGKRPTLCSTDRPYATSHSSALFHVIILSEPSSTAFSKKRMQARVALTCTDARES